MARYWSVGIVAFVAFVVPFSYAGETDFQAKGTLTKDDPIDAERGGAVHVHKVKLKAGKTYTIDLMAAGYDAYLRLLDPKGLVLAEDDDGGEGLNSRIIFSCTKSGEYRLLCTSFGAAGYGDYTLSVKLAGSIQTPPTAHAALLGKPAPECVGDFALNGKAIPLADLKGKVVLLHFWEVRSFSSRPLFAKLSEWQASHKEEGLEVVGITFYPSDIDDRVAFDAKTGGVKTSTSANHQSDQALLEAFAKHHKMDYLQMALPYKDAINTFSAYAVNGLPQLVIIDRKGTIRMIDVNGEKSFDKVENEIKKALAEK